MEDGAVTGWRIWLFVAAIMLLPISAGVAAGRGDSRIPSWRQSHLEESNPAIRALYVLAVCVRNHRREAVEQLLMTQLGTAEEADAIQRLLPPGEDPCLIGVRDLRISDQALLRGAVAEAVYNGSDIHPRSAAPLATAAASSEMPVTASAGGRDVATCAVRRNPMLAHTVVRTNYGTPGELRALRALTPTFLACLPNGAALRVTRLAIRAYLAEALFHASRSFRESFVNA